MISFHKSLKVFLPENKNITELQIVSKCDQRVSYMKYIGFIYIYKVREKKEERMRGREKPLHFHSEKYYFIYMKYIMYVH